ncbi:MAG: DUF4832 domain-containing protein [Lentisphaerae bacterium]|jgi:hypothetical protein|nr:DUF4832 domain-containing protein [Lentisphaerota bacterium]MBT5606986.1 DUF4832 domain-containing protein [Lentisphaerota bacterium]MBT7056282.1 DUF4832 domain-containing protein [Lentisphaerota bacterium]MBT7844159.1 DUF4832 domain-containing protein [Lentisphaerota bacterium]
MQQALPLCLSLALAATTTNGHAQDAGKGGTAGKADKGREAVELVTVKPAEFPGAINNPLKGFRGYHSDGYGLLHRKYVPWNAIETGAADTVERVIAHTNKICRHRGKGFEELNVKLVPRVFLDWDGTRGTAKRPKQHWPADMAEFDYDSPEFHQRLIKLITKMGQAWDNDPRIFAVQMGLIGYWGEHHNPAPTAKQRHLLVRAFRNAFRNKPVLVRHTDPEFMDAGFGIYYDTFANVGREPHMAEKRPYVKGQFPWQATHVYPDIWKRSPIEGEVEYNWQKQRKDADPEGTFGRTPDETMTAPSYRRYMIDKIRRYHTSYLGWISGYSSSKTDVLTGAGEVQKAFGYRLVIESLSYTPGLEPGGELTVAFSVRNTGSAPFYLDWPVAAALLDPETRKPMWSSPLQGIDIRTWLPGERWNSDTFTYEVPAKRWDVESSVALPKGLAAGEYIVALAILDRQGDMIPSARFAIANYVAGGWHPFGYVGVGAPPRKTALDDVAFDSPAFDRTLSYRAPQALLAVQPPPPLPEAVTPSRWKPDPTTELINPWRYWCLVRRSETVEKRVSADGPVAEPADRKVITVAGDYGRGSNLTYTFFDNGTLGPGNYRFSCKVKGTAGQSVRFDVADGWRSVAGGTDLPLATAWQEHAVEFEIAAAFKNGTRMRFSLPHDTTGEFHLTDYHLRRTQ